MTLMTENLCSAGCPTPGEHESWGQCVSSKRIKTQWLGGTGTDFGREKKFRAENEAYRTAVKQGLQPRNVSMQAIREAESAAEKGA